MSDKTPKGWHSRGFLPHYEGGSIIQFITCRLFDSLPRKILEGFRAELAAKNMEDILTYIESQFGFNRLKEF